jgi:hypothetical protein
MTKRKSEPEVIDPTKIDLLDHTIHPDTLKHICAGLEWKKAFHLEADAKRVERGEKPLYAGMPSAIFLHESIDCAHCGWSIPIEWSGKDDETPKLGRSILPPEEWKESHRPVWAPEDGRCPVPTPMPIKMRFTCKSGRVAMANDLREYFPSIRERGSGYSLNSLAGKENYIRWYASHGYLTGYVGNTHVWFVPKDGGLDVLFPGWGDAHVSEDEWDRLDKVCTHGGSTALWWFTVVDASDLPLNAVDSGAQPPGFMDLPIGEYEVVVQTEDSADPVVCTIRPVEAAPCT